MHHLKRSPCTMAAASMHNLAGHGAQFRRKRCAKAAELSPRLLHTLDAEVEHPRRRNWTENDTGSHCPEHWLCPTGMVALILRTPGSARAEYSAYSYDICIPTACVLNCLCQVSSRLDSSFSYVSAVGKPPQPYKGGYFSTHSLSFWKPPARLVVFFYQKPLLKFRSS